MEIVEKICQFVFIIAPLLGGLGFWLWKVTQMEKNRNERFNSAVKAHEDACNAVRCYLYERMRRDDL